MKSGSSTHAALVRQETITNVVASAIIAALISWLVFRKADVIDIVPLPRGGLFGIIPGTFNFTLLVTLALTLVTRRRVSRGQHTRASGAPTLALPRNVLLRSLLLAACVTALFVPLTYGAVWVALGAGICAPQWHFPGILAFYVAYFVVLAWLVTPIVIRRGLQD